MGQNPEAAAGDALPAPARAAFPASVRLRQPHEFKKVLQSGIRNRSSLLSLTWTMNDGLGPRLGFAIAKRSIRKAVGRNRVRRIVREYFRLHRESLPSVDIVVMAQTQAADATFKALCLEMDMLCKRLRQRCAMP